METDLYFDIADTQWPIIYREEYNVSFCKLEKLHPFDARKWGRVFKFLKEARLVDEETIVKPNEAKKRDLLVVHTQKYLRRLRCSIKVACIAEVPILCMVPNCLVQRFYLRPMRYQVGGSILAGKLALEKGYSINIGGGFHHCSAGKGGGFCAYADITLLIEFLFKYHADRIRYVMIVDLDAHQGNGYEKDFFDNSNVYIMDVYNSRIYPTDHEVKSAIDRKVEISPLTADKKYLKLVARHLSLALSDFDADLVVYNAGTDILNGDRLGCLSVTANGVIERDALVFKLVRSKKIPIVMLTSGGYTQKSAKIIANSIMNLHNLGLIDGPHSRF